MNRGHIDRMVVTFDITHIHTDKNTFYCDRDKSIKVMSKYLWYCE